MSVRQFLKCIALPILATTCVLVALSACAGASAAPANVSARVAAHVSQDSGEPTCQKPDAQSIEVSSSAGTSGRLGTSAGLEGEEDVTSHFLKLIGDGALSFGEEKGLGWLLSVVTGQQEQLDPAHVDEQFDEVNRKLDALGDQQYEDCQALVSAIHQAKVNDDLNAYSLLASEMSDQIGQLQTYQDDFQDIVDELQSNGGDISALNDTYKDDLRAMIEGTKDGLLNIINTINIKMAGNSPGAKAMVSYYTQVLTDEFPYDPYKTHIFTPAFLNAGAAQQGYYAALIDQAVYLYSNVAHLDFTAPGGFTHTSDPKSVVTLVNRAQTDIQHWSSLFADGPADQTWVSQGHGAGLDTIPDGTVLDYRSQSKPLLWTIAPVGVNGERSDPAPYYCPSTAQFCYADQYNAAGLPGDTRLVRPSPESLAKIVGAEDIGGVTGWRVPTSGDWSSLIQGASGGLTAWASANQLGNMFATQQRVFHYGGKDQTLTTIAPMLVNTGTTGSPSYSVLSSTDPSANTLTLEKPDIGDSGQSDVAGRLFLSRDYQPTTPPQDFSTTRVFTSPTEAGTSTRTAEAGSALTTRQPAPTRTATAQAARVEPARGTGAGAVRTVKAEDVPGPTAFSTAVACSSASIYRVPAGVGAVKITATGGAGADGLQDTNAAAPGGVGGTVTETVPVTAGDTLYVQVGGLGAGRDDRRGGVGGGGNGGLSHSDIANAGDYAGGGGGASGVATTPNCSHWLIVAGGGGGGGAGFKKEDGNPRGDWAGGRGGNGCAGQSGCQAAADGKGYSQPTAGHAGGTAPNNNGGALGVGGTTVASAGGNGSTLKGGDGGASTKCCSGVGGGGGGGGGYYGGGGGGGAGYQAGGGGGGGGASFAIPGATDVGYGLGSAGKAGSVTISPIGKQPASISLSVTPGNLEWDQPMPVMFTAKLPVDAAGTITFHNQYGVYGTAPIRNGVATLPELKVALPVGTDSMQASFQGDNHYLAADSNSARWQVTKNKSPMNLTITGTQLKSGQSPKSLVVQMPSQATGSVGFYNDINQGCEGGNGPGAKCQGLGVAPIVNGYAVLTQLSTQLQSGPNRIHASYGGDSEYGDNSRFSASDSNVVTVNVGR